MAFGKEAEGIVNSVVCSDEVAFKLCGCVSRHNSVNWVNCNPHSAVCCDISSLALAGQFSFGIIVGECY